MCGIVGIVATTGRELTAQLQPMLDAQAHRGPDAWGVWPAAGVASLCAFGHRRLAIIDLSAAGKQPMSNADGSVWITFNGEIYNFQQLRRELESRGHRFRTRTDTETIIYAYEEWGVECVKHLRGMFAFGIWDARRQRLLLARDRVGKKPLFYAQAGERFLFASELQGLLADAEVPRVVNAAAIDAYLSYGYIPAPHTAYQGVFKLPPAHWLTLDVTPDGFTTRVERYWSLAYQPKLTLSAEEAGEQLRAVLTEAVRLRMISDVPLGAFLSGGIDSSIVVGLMAQLSGQPVKTFSIGFAEAAFNETEHARRIAQKWQTEHHEFIVQPNALEILPKLVRHYGEPYADSSALPTFYVAQLTRQHVTVALNGDGGDESFAGYERYLGNRVAERMQAVPGAAWAGRTLGGLLPDSLDPKNRLRTLRRFLSVAAQPMAERYTRWLSFFHTETKLPLYSPEFAAQLNGTRDGYLNALFAEVLQNSEAIDPIDAAMAVDVQSYLPFDLLVKVDITSMANSLEARSPFLDHEVMELAARLPAHLKAPGKDLKHLLKRTFADLLPPENVNRRKMGFGVPVGAWFRRELRDFVRDVLLSPTAVQRGYFKRAEVERLVTEHQAGRADYAFQLWSLLMLELWQREFIAD
ncbi:MAG: asparagine synthase (glutamine-hydrolyzing) [Acidobacteria bacterium]|nr:asparagine synthase (glutamine-hydrolyzing) [Acidobacteriota bacterium]MBI3426767.1 asparagine synthase (glutamine-hydrolyzing) [Acidobacteriota bacterium]